MLGAGCAPARAGYASSPTSCCGGSRSSVSTRPIRTTSRPKSAASLCGQSAVGALVLHAASCAFGIGSPPHAARLMRLASLDPRTRPTAPCPLLSRSACLASQQTSRERGGRAPLCTHARTRTHRVQVALQDRRVCGGRGARGWAALEAVTCHRTHALNGARRGAGWTWTRQPSRGTASSTSTTAHSEA